MAGPFHRYRPTLRMEGCAPAHQFSPNCMHFASVTKVKSIAIVKDEAGAFDIETWKRPHCHGSHGNHESAPAAFLPRCGFHSIHDSVPAAFIHCQGNHGIFESGLRC